MQALNMCAEVIKVSNDKSMFTELLSIVYGGLKYPNYKDDCCFTNSVGDVRDEVFQEEILAHIRKPQRYIVNG